MLFSIIIDYFKSQFQYHNKNFSQDDEPTVRDGSSKQCWGSKVNGLLKTLNSGFVDPSFKGESTVFRSY